METYIPRAQFLGPGSHIQQLSAVAIHIALLLQIESHMVRLRDERQVYQGGSRSAARWLWQRPEW